MTTASLALPTIQPFGGRARRRMVGIVSAVTLLYCTILALNVAVLLLPPRLSLAVSIPSAGRARVEWVLPGSVLWDRGVRARNRVMSLDGRSPTRQVEGFWQGSTVVVRTANGTISVSANALRRGHNTWPLVVLSPWFLLLGTLIMLRAPTRQVGEAAYAFFAAAALALALAPASDNDIPLASALEVATVLIFAYTFVRFFREFPLHRRWGAGGPALAVAPAVAVCLDLAALAWPALYGPAMAARLSVVVVYLLLGAGLMIGGFRASDDAHVRLGFNIVGVGTAVSVLPFVLLSLIPPIFHHRAIVPAEGSILALALLPASLAYAILRHRVLPISLVQRWIVPGALWAGLFAACGGVIRALQLVTDSTSLSPILGLWITAAMLLIGAISLRWVHRWLLSVFDRLFFKDAYDYRASLQQLSRDLSLAGDLDALGECIPARLRHLMNLRFVSLLIHGENGVTESGMVGSYHVTTPAALVEAVTGSDVFPSSAALEGNDGFASLIPLMARDSLVGYLCLGPKISGEPFRDVDRDLLATLSGHLATLIRNAQLTDELSLKVQTLDVLNERLEHARDEERAKLAADLHDEPLQMAIELGRQLRRAGGQSDNGSLSALSKELASRLRTICTTARPPVLDDLGLSAALDLLVADAARRTAHSIGLDADAEVVQGIVSSEVELTLYRAAQEALSNCLRHSQARAIRVSLHLAENGVRLRVVDDGIGFAVASSLDNLAATGHLGLAGMRQRVERAGGRVSVQSTPGEGAAVQVDVPSAAM
ncbi:MAG: GAF domain-containing sensor histidine kinase [Chloroflexota bacterium]|nr:GAF domain-containing sensor histidine kinase [Chloroflexota bacterium]